MLTRRRFIAISAALAPSVALARTPDLHVETGIALGATVTLRLHHPDAPRIAALAMAEIRRLEGVFSLYLPDSALVRLNRDARLEAPPLELLECLTLAGSVHRASGGAFDPTVQPLWQAKVEALTRGAALTEVERAKVRALIGWDGVVLDPAAITLRPGMALTLNGIAQGYIADRVAALLEAEGLTNILIDTGEHRALGPRPDGNAWPIRAPGRDATIPLTARALATSAPLGTTFDAAGRDGHILDPGTGAPSASTLASISISAPTAALADALATAACLTEDEADLATMLAAFPDCREVAALWS